MPLPLVIIGLGALAGAAGVGEGAKAVFEKLDANNINKNAMDVLNQSTQYIEDQRNLCKDSLTNFACLKIDVLNGSIKKFINTFQKIKNIDFNECENLDEFNKCHIDSKDFDELKSDVDLILPFVGGAVAGATGGALVAFGAYGAAQAFACASTGTAIASLSGAAASNATLAFFGGGSLAVGGLGMAGGAVVLGTIVAAPTLLIMGVIADIAAKKDLENAHINQENVKQIIAELSIAGLRCAQIRRRIYIYENLLSSLDARFMPLLFKMEDIVNNEGFDYLKYSNNSKKVIASTACTAVSIKAILDKTVLDDDGNLTEDNI